MREIKFRAWVECDWYNLMLSPSYKGTRWRMAEVKGLFLSTNKARLSIVNDNGKRSYDVSLDEIKLMQYTGLKDKNGVEIYEGDILKSKDLNPVGVVKYGMASFCIDGWVDHLGYDVTFNRTITPEEVEIIGNIYEHPELLNEK